MWKGPVQVPSVQSGGEKPDPLPLPSPLDPSSMDEWLFRDGKTTVLSNKSSDLIKTESKYRKVKLHSLQSEQPHLEHSFSGFLP